MNKTTNQKGFTLIELLVVILIMGFLLTAATIAFTDARRQSRDSQRVANMDDFGKALSLYLTNSQNGFPVSSGECLRANYNVGSVLRNAQAISQVATDPLWPTAGLAAGTQFASGGDNNFCYWYWSDGEIYYISYYLEGDSKYGTKGIHVKSINK